MSAIIITHGLRPNVSPADFEAWVKDHDHLIMRGVGRVKRFATYRATGLLESDS